MWDSCFLSTLAQSRDRKTESHVSAEKHYQFHWLWICVTSLSCKIFGQWSYGVLQCTGIQVTSRVMIVRTHHNINLASAHQDKASDLHRLVYFKLGGSQLHVPMWRRCRRAHTIGDKVPRKREHWPNGITALSAGIGRAIICTWDCRKTRTRPTLSGDLEHRW